MTVTAASAAKTTADALAVRSAKRMNNSDLPAAFRAIVEHCGQRAVRLKAVLRRLRARGPVAAIPSSGAIINDRKTHRRLTTRL
jgi:hypothetical protein